MQVKQIAIFSSIFVFYSNIMKEYKSLFLFLLKFLGTYVLLILLYNLYLENYLPAHEPDPYTAFTSNMTSSVLNFIGFPAESYHIENEPYYRIAINGISTSIVNEGCNALSIMIIFVAFIVAFSTNFKTTFLYILVGLVFLFLMNIGRIVLLNWIFRYHSSYGKMAHDYLFPALIYGSIVILWIVWIRYFVMKKNKHNNEEVA